ncbi:MAG: hypothetical protein QM774_04450 [Gordonia sp. (in: high G+C Gram-positive bacteria)]|uniref:Rv1476 family membrane protein n=1 Tax=Gordonia sp. (in: high G+C Gram-positive bacteria) TaxID=84139 RepID=UPI0039E2F573
MSGPVTITLAAPVSTTDQWKNLDIAGIAAQLKQTGVYAPDADRPGLEALVARGAKDGHHLHYVVLEESFTPFTVNRDIANTLQKQVGGTVIVFTPTATGTSSTEFSRVQLEDGTSEMTTISNPVQAANEIYDRATDPYVNWTAVTIGLIVAVLVGAVLARFWQLRSRRVAAAAPVPGDVAEDAAEAVDTAAASDDA